MKSSGIGHGGVATQHSAGGDMTITKKVVILQQKIKDFLNNHESNVNICQL